MIVGYLITRHDAPLKQYCGDPEWCKEAGLNPEIDHYKIIPIYKQRPLKAISEKVEK